MDRPVSVGERVWTLSTRRQTAGYAVLRAGPESYEQCASLRQPVSSDPPTSFRD